MPLSDCQCQGFSTRSGTSVACCADLRFAVNSFLTCNNARFAACASGQASCLALAARPAGLAEAPGSRVCGAKHRRAVGAPLRLEGPARTMRGAPVPVR